MEFPSFSWVSTTLPLSAVFFDCSLADKPGPYCGKVTKCDPSRNSHTWVCVGFYILCHCLLGLCLGLETSFLLVGLYKSHVKSILICEAKNSGLSVTSEVGSAFPIMRAWRKNEWGFCCCPSFLVEGLELIPGELSVLHNVLFLMISYFEDVSKRRIHSEYVSSTFIWQLNAHLFCWTVCKRKLYTFGT